MPRVEIDPKNRAESAYSYPKLRLTRNERARIIAIEPKPLMEYVHTLKAPQIVNGHAVMEGGQDGVPKVKEDFLGRYICSGAPEILSDKARDIDNCPICAVAAESDAVDWPSRRFAAHVIQYTNLKPNSFELQTWGIAIRAWIFADRTFNTLIEIAEDLGGGETLGDIRTRDLLLGPCENENFQKFEIRMSSQTGMWLRKDEFKKEAVELYTTGQTPHLEELIGRRGQDAMREDLQRVILRHRQAYGSEASAEDQSDAALAADALLGGDEIPADASVDEVLGGLGDLEPDIPAAPAESEAAPAAAAADPLAGLSTDGEDAVPEKEADEKADFDALLGDLPLN